MRTLSAVLALALFAGSIPVYAEQVPLPEPQEEGIVSPALEEVVLGEILATSTTAIFDEVIPEVLGETEEFTPIDPDTYVEGEVLVVFEEEVSEADMEMIEAVIDTDSVTSVSEDSLIIETDTSIESVIAELESLPDVAYAEPNYVRSIEALPTTTWNLEKIQTVSAHASSTGEGILVAVLDTGIDYDHPDLLGRMWDGSSCVSTTSVPIVGGCMHGYDFVDKDTDPATTTPTHATHVAGIIASVAPDASIMSLRIMDDSGNGSVSKELDAIRFAIANGADVINASFAGVQFSQPERDAIEAFENAGGLFIAAAGNALSNQTGHNIDTTPSYPASHNLAGIISVSATTETDTLATFSHFGPNSVDLGAPGTSILSTVPNSGYAYATGTSMAAPHVTGVAALLASLGMNANEIKERLLSSGDPLLSLCNKTVSGKRLNAFNAVTGVTTDRCDLGAPVITLNGDNPLTLAFAQNYVEPGATAHDDVDGDVSSSISIEGSVESTAPGSYTITYRASDTKGNEAVATREVIVAVEESGRPRGGGGGGGGGKKKNDPVRSVQSGIVLGATTPYLFLNDLTEGSASTDVRELQKTLKNFGYFVGSETGTFDATTKASVMAFQTSRGLPATGTLDTGTRASLNYLSTTLAYLYSELARLLALRAA